MTFEQVVIFAPYVGLFAVIFETPAVVYGVGKRIGRVRKKQGRKKSVKEAPNTGKNPLAKAVQCYFERAESEPIAEKTILLLVSLGLAANLLEKFIPVETRPLLSVATLMTFFLFVVYLAIRHIEKRFWFLSILPSLYGVTSVGLIVVLLVVEISAKVRLPFSAVVLALSLFLIPFLMFIRRVLTSGLPYVVNIMATLMGSGFSLAFILFVLGVYNLTYLKDGTDLLNDASVANISRIMHIGGYFLFNLADPKETTDSVVLWQYLIGFFFNTLVIGSLASVFSGLFSHQDSHHNDSSDTKVS